MLFKRDGEFKEGLNPIIVNGRDKGSMMDFSVLKLGKGQREEFNIPMETLFLLIQGEVTFEWNDEQVTVNRVSCFTDDPVCLQVPMNQKVVIRGVGENAEIAVMSAENQKSFAPIFYGKNQCESVMRGEGTLRETATRIVRNIINLENSTFSRFFLGEVVNFPGKWSSFPPHQHDQPEIYYYKMQPENGYGFSEDGDDVHKVHHNDACLFVDRAKHSQSAAPGYAMYYIWVIGHLEGNPHTGPDAVTEHVWTMKPDSKIFPEV